MKTILFPTDFSERANKALAEALSIISRFDAKLIIFHVYHRPENNLLALEGKIDLQFKKLLEDNNWLSNVKHEFHKELGISTEIIPKYANDIKADLIIMATKGANGFDELWGTKTAAIVKKVKVPILVIPDHTSLKDIGKCGLVCDYSKETNYHALDFLITFLEDQRLDTEIITLNRREKIMTHEEKGNRMLVRKKLESVPAAFNFTFHNNVDKGIIDYCQSNGIGLIAILPKSYSFIRQLFHESLTEKMIFRSPIPLLILK
jgi:nucleotide-binding universal stress UspA family protein